MSVTFQPAGDLAVLVELKGDIGDELSTRRRAITIDDAHRIKASAGRAEDDFFGMSS